MEHDTQDLRPETDHVDESGEGNCVQVTHEEAQERKTDKAFRYRNVVVRERKVDGFQTPKSLIILPKIIPSACDTCLSCDVRQHSAKYCCIQCEVYICSDCNEDHGGHSTRTEEQGLSCLVDELIIEQNREDAFEEIDISPLFTVDVCSGVDEEKCWITGCSFVGKNQMVACDYNNDCLKIIELNLGNIDHVKRYIRISYGPWNATLVNDDSESSVKAKASAARNDHHDETTSEISDTNAKIRTSGNSPSSNEEQILAVTCPDARQILFVDIAIRPAVKLKTLRIDGECFGIEISNAKIFTSCKEPHNQYRMTIHILDLNGNFINIINTEFYSGRQWAPPCFVLLPEKEMIYFTSGYHGIVQCVDFSGKVISTFTDNGPGLRGICMDETENLYVCANNDDAIFKLSPDLEQCDVVVDKAIIRMKWPQSVTMYRDKLFITHYFRESENIQNHINIVRIL